jgi:hypothetical protein
MLAMAGGDELRLAKAGRSGVVKPSKGFGVPRGSSGGHGAMEEESQDRDGFMSDKRDVKRYNIRFRLVPGWHSPGLFR